jgi:hypothetical protein
MVDALALGASVARRGGSSPFIRTNARVAELVDATDLKSVGHWPCGFESHHEHMWFGWEHYRRSCNKSVKSFGINSFHTSRAVSSVG